MTDNHTKYLPSENSAISWIVEDAAWYGEYLIKIWFRDGSIKTVDLSSLLKTKTSPLFQQLKDVNYFSQLRYDEEIETIAWPNGVDIAPEYLYKNGVDVNSVDKKRRA